MTREQTPYETSDIMASQGDMLPAKADGIPAIEIANLVKTFRTRSSVTSSVEFRSYLAAITGRGNGQVTALDGVNLRVSQGEVFGLLGPNGAGKTTLIKILSTLVLPDSGEAQVYGVDVVRKPRAALRKLQTVLAQGTGFELRLSGRRNLELYAALYGIPGDVARRKISYLLEFTGLADRADSPFQTYSTGMARKLLVCRALMSNASLLIFDEPTSSLDPVSAMEFRRFIKRNLVEKEGKTVFLATHNLHEAQQICSRIALIQKGRIVAIGTPSQIRAAIGDRVNLTITLGGTEDANVRYLNAELNRIDGLIEVGTRVIGDRLALTIVGGKQIDYNSIFELLLRMNLKIESLEATEPSLEQAFMSLINRSEH